ncbi:MAG TPA: MBL fold metallo-hydrolase [Dehalococcoidia bacterium]|jgi:glyoxylase-like metal-dependent hydrolase (beta-lactamase superfamily II)|nr:MBL fold metallo-hydrolase [Dehalococcoidia bacterium]HIK88892.1 MBL fold metallo-hydrolase [Dehalococcoidia bacterium]
MVQIDVVQVGVLATSCYVIHLAGNSNCVVVDPGSEQLKIVEFLRERNLSPTSIISTHAHADHTGAVAPLVEQYGSKFMIGTADAQSAADQLSWLKSMLGDFQEPPVPARLLDDGDVIDAEGFEIKVLATPGHTSGSISLHVDGHVLTGDTLFRETIGRFDLSDGDEQLEIASIKNVLFDLDDDTIVLPGHGASTTIAHEKANNRFVR